jgi:hypothetical protein
MGFPPEENTKPLSGKSGSAKALTRHSADELRTEYLRFSDVRARVVCDTDCYHNSTRFRHLAVFLRDTGVGRIGGAKEVAGLTRPRPQIIPASKVI